MLAVLVLASPSGMAGPDGPPAYADAEALTDPAHRTHMQVPAGGPYPIRDKITIGLDKSMLVELPVDLQNVLVSNPEVLDAVVQTSRQVYLIAKDLGEANAFFIGPGGEKVLFLEVSVTRDLTALRDLMARLIPGSDIAVEMMGESVVLSGSVATPADANRAAELAGRFVKKKDGVVNLLATDSKEQVLLKVQVAEMQRDALRRFGVDIANSLLSAGNFTFAKVIKNGFPVTSSVVAQAAAGAAGVAPFAAAGSAFVPSWQTGEQSITGLVQALERAGVLKTLAEPTLTAISGEEAKFLAGGEFPVPVAQDQNKVTVEWKPFGVNVAFKPVVLDEGRISLTVSAEVSEITTEGGVQLANISLPGLKVRRAETTLELPSGGTLAMAGLLSDDTRQSIEGVPGLKELPVLGALFRSQDYRRRETELVILVTPYLATHQARDALAKPTDNYAPASGLQQLFFGHINRVYGLGEASSEGYRGDYGFIVDYPGVKG
ncbi:MAG: type II and III secretion system protein family protein [Hyphomicrobiaceae bacterium]|nr:type II and III secretion system protein family protein [Hyphomicrobiaceae bacterium]